MIKIIQLASREDRISTGTDICEDKMCLSKYTYMRLRYRTIASRKKKNFLSFLNPHYFVISIAIVKSATFTSTIYTPNYVLQLPWSPMFLICTVMICLCKILALIFLLYFIKYHFFDTVCIFISSLKFWQALSLHFYFCFYYNMGYILYLDVPQSHMQQRVYSFGCSWI